MDATSKRYLRVLENALLKSNVEGLSRMRNITRPKDVQAEAYLNKVFSNLKGEQVKAYDDERVKKFWREVMVRSNASV